METYVIASDAACDIDASFFENNDICLFPMSYSHGEEMISLSSMKDDASLKAFYEGQRNGSMTMTSQITPYLYKEYVTPYLKNGISVLYIALSGGLSSTCRSACIAARELEEEFKEVRFMVLDSLSASGGMGILLERAIRNQKKGMDMNENFSDLQEAVKHLHHWFSVSDLMYLKRGGRLSASAAMIASALNIKPILQIDTEGKLPVIRKVKGNKASLRTLLDYYHEFREEEEDPIYLCHSDNEEAENSLEEMILQINPKAIIRKKYLSPIIGAHTGPGLASIIHIGKERKNLG